MPIPGHTPSGTGHTLGPPTLAYSVDASVILCPRPVQAPFTPGHAHPSPGHTYVVLCSRPVHALFTSSPTLDTPWSHRPTPWPTLAMPYHPLTALNLPI